MAGTAETELRPPTDRFPGWWVVTGAFIVLMTSAGLGFYGLAVYLNTLSKERGWEVSSISLATTFFFFVGGIVGVWAARLISRYDVRHVIAAGGVTGGVALLGLGRVTATWQLFVVYGVFAFGFAFAGLVPVTTVVTRWFHPAGGCPMAATEAAGVVDHDGQVFGAPGVYVAGAATFPTAGAGNPTLTIVAMALRLADHIGTLA